MFTIEDKKHLARTLPWLALSLTVYFALVFTLGGCGRHDNEEASTPILEQAKPFHTEACASYRPEQTPKCDRSTFVAAMTTICAKDFGLSQYKKAPGVFWRSPEDCMASQESTSQCSRDTYLWVLFNAWKKKDFATIQEIHDFGISHDWLMCDGPEGVVGIKPLVSLINKMLASQTLTEFPMPDDLDAVLAALQGFRGHLIDGYLWFRASVLGGLTSAVTLKIIHEQTPDSPWFSSLFHRFQVGDGDQGESLELMKKTPHEDGTFGWGSSPFWFHLAATYAVMKGE